MTNNLPPASRTALRTLLIVLAVAVGVVIYAYGWNTTEISLDEVKDETRQASVKRAMRELLSPDLFTRDREDVSYFVAYTIGCPEGDLPAERVNAQDTDGETTDAYVIFSPPCAGVDDVITVEGHDFPDNAIARLQLVRDTGQRIPFKLAASAEQDAEVSDTANFDVDGVGYFNITVKVPRGRGLSGETHRIEIQTVVPTGWPRFSDTTETVIDKMIETIFLALMATTLALPVAVVLSFVAARNLMRQVSLPLGNVLVGFVLLPVGAVLGARLVGPVGELGVDLGQDVLPGLIVAPVGLVVFSVVAGFVTRLDLSGLPKPLPWLDLPTLATRLRPVVLNALLLAVLVLVLGVLGGLGIKLGEELESGLLEDLGAFAGTLGELVDLTVAAFAGIGGAFWLASVGAGLVAGPLRHVYGLPSHALGAALGAVGGAILLAATATIGAQAVLLGLLTPIVAAVIGGQLLVQVYGQLYLRDQPRRRVKADQSDTEQVIRTVLFSVGAVLAFIATAYALDLIRAVVDQRLPSEITRDYGLFEVRAYVADAVLIGAVLGGVAGGLAGIQTTFPLGMTVYNTSRTILNALRSIEPLIMGIVFVIWVGVGPFAGVLALTLHSIAALGKLYSEQVENIDAGPIEAIQSTGANRLQTVIYAVVPQIVPPYIAFTMYRWDINVRMSTIIGFVGGGGIGFLLQQQINLLRYKQAGVAVLAIAIVVSVLDYASAAIRERIV